MDDITCERLCCNLSSNKIRLRKDTCDELSDILTQKSTVEFLNSNNRIDWWQKILNALLDCVFKDFEKQSAKINTNVTTLQSADLFIKFIRLAVKEEESIDFLNLFHTILDGLKNPTIKGLQWMFLKILSDNFLTYPHIRIVLEESAWSSLYFSLKSLCGVKSDLNTEQIKSLALVIKLGPLCCLPVNIIRQEFTYIAKLCKTISSKSPKPHQDFIIELIYDLCQHTAPDNRTACCILSENIFPNLIDLYEGNPNDDKIKSNLIKLFHLLVIIHNPKGVKENHPASYAYSWNDWKNCLYKIYDLVMNEINTNLKMTIKNQLLFLRNNGICELYQDFVQLFVQVCRQLFDEEESPSEEPPQKRRKREFNVGNLINKIKDTKSWAWLNLTYPLLEAYPSLIKPEQYTDLLKNLLSYQKESKDSSLLHHIHKTLIVFQKIELDFNLDKTEIENLWKLGAESTLRLLSQNDDKAQILLQFLLKRHLTPSDNLFQYFKSLSPTEDNLKTIIIIFKTYTHLQCDTNIKTEIMNWILSHSVKFLLKDVAVVLVCLVLKQWPQDVKSEAKIPSDSFHDLEDLYLSVCLENLLISLEETERVSENDSVCLDRNLLKKLTQFFNQNSDSDVEDLLNICVLLFHFISLLDKFKLVEVANIYDLDLYRVFEISTNRLFTIWHFEVTNLNERTIVKFINYSKILNNLFVDKNSQLISRKLRDFIPEEFIREMFMILNSNNSDESFFELKKSVMETLVSFSCLPESNISEMQEKALHALLDFDYDYSNNQILELAWILLYSIKNSKAKNLTDINFKAIFNIFQRICEVRYYCYESVVKFLNIFCDIYPMVVESKSNSKESYIEILYPFYVKKNSYGPLVSIGLIKCMTLLFELEPTCDDLRWCNSEIILKIPEFLISEYQSVRFSAIKALGSFFQITSRLRRLDCYHLQEIMFTKTYEMSLKIFEIEGDFDETRIIDESVSRTACVLHIFATIIISSNLWIEEALFSLLKIATDKKLDLVKIEKILELVANKLGFKSTLNFIEKYLIGIINRWQQLHDFPVKILKCSSLTDLYTKYWSSLAHIFFDKSEGNVTEIASNLKKPTTQLIQDICPKLLSYCLAQEISDFSSITNNQIYQLLSNSLGKEKIQEIFKTEIEEIILCLIELISDENHFEDSFGKRIIFPKTRDVCLKVEEFQNCLEFIEATIYHDKSIVLHLMQNNPEKIHFILLQINIRLNLVQGLEDKLRYFHLYSLLAITCVENLKNEASMQTYLLRDLTHTLLHQINNHQNQPDLSEMSCKFFKKILMIILPDLSQVLGEFFLMIISRLKHVVLENCPISNLCLQMLELLIVEHKTQFISEIEKIDSIPQTTDFTKIYNVYFSVKYNNRKVTLEDEIIQFVESSKDMENLDECEHNITHLKTLLINRKYDFKNMCLTLRKTRGFSEDCKTSNLHKLICVLITLSCSKNVNVSMEATRCLGEIGPADLATLILEPEKDLPDIKWIPWELVLGCACSLLSKYLIDSDVKVLKTASLALFQIFSTKDGRKVAESGSDFGFGAINYNYFVPFSAIRVRSNNFKLGINGDYFLEKIGDDNLWIPEHSCHKTWIQNLVTNFLGCFNEGDFFKSFIEICKLKVEFCEQILPLLVYTVLYLNNLTFTNVISSQLEIFFDKHWDITIGDLGLANTTTNKSSVQTLLNIVHFVRLQKSFRKKEIKNLRLDYLKIAKAAHFCNAHFTALLYAELWCQEQISFAPNDYILSTCTYTKLDLIYEKTDAVTCNALQNIFRQAYKAVGESDAVWGCGTFHLLDPSSRVEHYKELGRWDQVTQYYEREVSLGRDSAHDSLIISLKNSNFYQLSLFCSNAYKEANYESLWRLGQWDYNGSDSINSYDKSKFYALKALHENEEFSLRKFINDARVCVVEDFMSVNMESIKNFYNTFARLQCLKEIEDFAGCNELVEIISKWRVQDEIVSNDYQYLEAIQAQRILLLVDYLKTKPLEHNSTEIIVDFIIEYAQCARIEGNSHVAFRILENLRLLQFSDDIIAKIKLEEAQLCWSIQDVLTAKCILRQLTTTKNVNPRIHAMALKLTGQWMVESSSENREIIIENYFKKSLKLLKNCENRDVNDEKTIIDTLDQLARFADHEYIEVMSYIKSDIFQKKKQNIIKSINLVEQIDVRKTTRDNVKAVRLKREFSSIDQREINNIEIEKNYLLTLALRYYLRNLVLSDNYNMTVFRVFSLLLENRKSEIIIDFLKKDFPAIPTYKFINILPQIIPHISTISNDIFTQTVNNLIEKCAIDHPYHTLPLILALALSNKDRDYSISKAVTNDTRTQSAKIILKNLKKNSKLSTVIDRMQLVSEAVIELAYSKSQKADKGFKIPRNMKIKKILNYDDVLVPTYILQVDKSCRYERIIGISCFGDTYFNVGGINAPKRITCKGTDGVIRTQLIKGQDDLRQDAVMQQVFTIMNNLLSLNKQTKNLRIRTYKIVPLSMRSGILEWVDNTIPIGDYLTGSDGGAHVKFRPMDKSPSRCRTEFKNIANIPTEEKLRIFNEICKNIKPVFHKFFETSFPQPTVWYERRRTYIHSVATSSMCGYILGIGDRHLSNILIDENTAEVVHIDFGIAFEQGRVLPTPETVPFRLSRDIVDGMGVSGVEGVFRKSCERTMEVLRIHHQTIITILEVLLYDPLYDWTVSTAEANKRQKDEQDESMFEGSSPGGSQESASKNVNETAERALLRLRAKLLGTETGKSSTVTHQVGTLIQQAVNPSNLCKLFHGWQPFL